MALRFTKMQGLGNDFVVLDATAAAVEITPERARFIADRHYGIGCDQILLVEPPRSAEAQFGYRIFNADGSESGQCGNGARCFARFVREQGLTDADIITVDVCGGRMTLEALGGDHYRASLAVPVFEPADIPLSGFARAASYRITDVAGQTLECQALAIGNPHAVVRTQDVMHAPVDSLGRALESHAAFPERVNVGFMQVVDRGSIRLRVFERGAGETLACGSGAAAAVVAGIASGDLDHRVSVDLQGGRACVEWDGGAAPVYLAGPAERVFDGKLVWSEADGNMSHI